MEKYRKFDDSRVGVNPFVPNKEMPRSALLQILRVILMPIVVLIKLPFLLILFIVIYVLQMLKYIFFVPALVRPLERFINLLCFNCMLGSFGASKVTERYHQGDNKFDFRKNKTGETVKVDTSCILSGGENPTLLICNQTSLI